MDYSNTGVTGATGTINRPLREDIGKVLITGDLGFVGSATKQLFHKEGIIYVGYDILDGLDIRDGGRLEKVIQENSIKRILHLAAIARFSDADDNPKLAHETNVMGTRNIAVLANKYHIPVVYSSTGSVYMPVDEKPPITENFKAKGNSVYGCTKYMGETYIREVNPHIILRYAHLYGAEKRMHGLIGGFMNRIQRGLAPTLYGGKQSNDFTYIKDIALANFLAVTASWEKWNQVYNIGTGEEITAERAGKIICDMTGWKGSVDKKDARIVDPERFVYDISKADRILGFKAKFNFYDGLADMFKVLGYKIDSSLRKEVTHENGKKRKTVA